MFAQHWVICWKSSCGRGFPWHWAQLPSLMYRWAIRPSALMGHLWEAGKCVCPACIWSWRDSSHLDRTEEPLQKFALQFQSLSGKMWVATPSQTIEMVSSCGNLGAKELRESKMSQNRAQCVRRCLKNEMGKMVGVQGMRDYLSP